jgi:hypothetical protein
VIGNQSQANGNHLLVPLAVRCKKVELEDKAWEWAKMGARIF